MRKIGIGALGLVGGLLLALVVQDLLAVTFVRDGTIPLALGIVLGFLMPVLAVLGAIVALLIDGRAAGSRSGARRGE